MPKVKREIVTSRLGVCFICKKEDGKYRCPQCEMVTCSLPCIKQHKKQFQCSGIRNKTEFVPIKKMNEFHLLSDYRLLEELSRLTDACERDDSMKFTRKNSLPLYLQRFRKAVAQRQSRVYFLPKNFSRHKNNTTHVNWKSGRINWKLNVTFLHAQKYSITVDKCPEEIILNVVISKCLKTAIQRNKVNKSHLQAYQCSADDIQVLMQAEKVPEAHSKFYVLDNKKSLRDNFVGKRIVEYPQFFVVLKGFYSSQNVNSISDVGDGKSKKRLESLLISNYSLAKEEEDSSEDEEPEKPGTSKKDKEQDDDVSGGADEDDEDSLDEALDYLDEKAYKEILGDLYKKASTK